ncbi:transposase [Vibrio aestuarianus]|uniref:transposase n=1 Tax=Vibrio aestuarianus TaxID=28171 RepID=UPI001594E3BC|nr:transposase [Vibrio aestuarianus]MDE1234303.1 transposase [Vibrio aestuarianus]MDE1245251.1 transposase [Vibrio aestuarianus]NGZ64141.1 IS5/IS1182 family transposase [Vibrio aestuarianus subsp. cardii]
MPYKYNDAKRHHFKKHTNALNNYGEYNQALKQRGRFDIWISEDIINNWQYDERVYDGTDSPVKYPDSTIEACHYIRLVYKLPLRQAQGLIESLLTKLGMTRLQCPDYTLLSKRLKQLNFTAPRFRKHERPDDKIAAIAIDSTGLKRFGMDEWHQEKHKVNAKRSWRKAHFAVDEAHFIQGAVLTDKMYDTNAVYQTLENHFPNAEIVIPPKDNMFADEAHHPKRMSNLIGCFALGIIGWQSVRQYGKRNISETAMQRYKKIIGNTLHSRDFENQSKEMLLGCSILNRFTHIGMPKSYRVA